MQSFIAMITLLGEGAAPPLPTHPIAPGGPPPQIWPSPGHPAHPIAPGGLPPRPAHPIVIPPGSLAPGVPAHPIYLPSPPVEPTQPIYIPPGAVAPGVPAHPIVIPPPNPPGFWGGVAPPYPDQGLPQPQPKPEHPIVIPPAPPTEATDKALVLVVAPGQTPVWFIIDANDGLKPTHPQPKPAGYAAAAPGPR